jgi:Tfp pilus assembly protein PilV
MPWQSIAMRAKSTSSLQGQRGRRALTLLEVLVGTVVCVTMVLALYGAFTQCYFTMQMAREDLRATQILLQKGETIRLYGWHLISSNGFLPATFSERYDPSRGKRSTLYTGAITATNCPFSARYSNDLKEVTVRLTWKTGGLDRQREFQTQVARYGLLHHVK